MHSPAQLDSLVHHALVRGLLDHGRLPPRPALAEKIGVALTEFDASLQRLHDTHGLVLHPQSTETWVIHPFTTSPTLTWVQQGTRGWWAPCLWCGLGIANLVGGDVTIHTRLGGESEDIDIQVHDGEIGGDRDLWVHFPEPPRLAWGNVHHFCSRLLPFRAATDVGPWAERHGLPLGAVLPASQLASLARAWYGKHANADWRKWTVREAAEIFRGAGLEGPFWSLDTREGVY